MKKLITKGALAISSLMLFAAPGFCTTISLINTANGGNIDTTGATVTSLTNVPFNSLFDLGNSTTYTITNGLASLSGSTLTITGDVAGLTGLTSGTNTLFTITLLSALTNSNYLAGQANSSLNVSIPTTDTVTVNSTLLSDLGLSGQVATLLAGGGFIGSGSYPVGATSGVYSTTSNSLAVNLAPAAATPEPASMFLMGSTLIGAALFMRRKSLRT